MDRTSLLQQPPLAMFGRYEILGRIAIGGMAEIFLARATSELGASRTVVIKRVLAHVADDERFVRMFLDEIRLAMQLNHPSICHIYEGGQQDGDYFIAMEWVDGAPLGKIIKSARKQGGVPPATAARVVSKVAEALDYAHQARDAEGNHLAIVHRDVSPQNVMVSYDGVVKLLDFGIAKAETHAGETQDGQVKGKFAYMSPEQCEGEELDGRSDIFTLGICLYEALTARNLYRRKTEYESMRAIIEGPVPSVREVNPDLPEMLDDIVRMALAKRPEDRFQTAGAMHTALEHYLAETRQVVTEGRIAQLMRTLFEEEIAHGPMVEAASFSSRPGSSSRSAPVAPTTGAPGRRRWAILSLLMVLSMCGGLFAWYITGPGAGQGVEVAEGETAPAEGETAPTGELPPPEQGAVPGEASEGGQAPPWELGGELPTAPEAAAEAEVGRLVVRSQPANARVRFGEETLPDRTPTEVADLLPGTYSVTVLKQGHRRWRRDVEVTAGETTTIEAELEATPTETGLLSINTRPWSKVYVRGQLLGTTPIGRARVPTGTVRLRLEDRDGQDHERSVRVAPDEETRVFFNLTGP